MIIDTKYLGGTGSKINDTKFNTSLIRTVASFILAGIFVLPYLLLSKDHSLVFLYFFKYGLPVFFTTLFQFSFLKVILDVLGLVNR